MILVVTVLIAALAQRSLTQAPLAAYYYFMPQPPDMRGIYYPQQNYQQSAYGCQNRCYPSMLPVQPPPSPMGPPSAMSSAASNRYRFVYRPTAGGSQSSSASHNILSYIRPGRPPTVRVPTSSVNRTSSTVYRPISPQVPIVPNVVTTTTSASVTTALTTVVSLSSAINEEPKTISIVIYPESGMTETAPLQNVFPTIIPNVDESYGSNLLTANGAESMITIVTLPTPPPFTKISQNVPESRRSNPCPTGKPLIAGESRAPVTCNFVVQPNNGCPDGFWCHTGSSYETTTCCPNYHSKDRCSQPKTSGEGEDLIPRWYYDISARKCKRFLYKGLKGNANNFITHVQCLESCETVDRGAAYKNPCGSGPPARNLDGALFVCGPFASRHIVSGFAAENGAHEAKCPAGYFCHVGESIETTVCCEHSSGLVRDACLLLKNEGKGSSQLRRFYYDIDTRRCRNFTYRGIRGNENNFLSLQECRRVCGKYNDPCPTQFNPDMERRSCANDGANACDAGEWCHVGADGVDATVCCPGAVADPCKLAMDAGEGVANLTRWYADDGDAAGIATAPCRRHCRPFIYGGAKGNQNNFASQEQCESVCKSDCVNPCSNATLLIDAVSGRPRFCDAETPCPSDHWCHNGASEATSVCCTAVKRPCGLPLAEGDGHAVLSRWYYSKPDETCKRFTYRGIGGNQNNYITKEECLASCPNDDGATAAAPATPPAVENPCGGGALPLMVGSWAKACNPSHRCPSTHFCHIGAGDTPNLCCPKNGDPCDHPLAVGDGPSALRRFYFDVKTRSCREFTYRGAKGNANNFLSQSDCELVCQAGILRNPCASGAPLTEDSSGEAIVCGGDERCPAGYFCHVGGAPETTNCCPVTSKKSACKLSLTAGEGPERLQRWYFDAETQICQRFVYAGLKGNANNFLSETACREQCPGENPCLVGRPMTVTDKYGTESVLASCRGDEPLTSCGAHTHFCHVGAPNSGNVCCTRSALDACELPANHGVGDAELQRWFHNAAHGICESFPYAGARGNENNFLTREACERNCPSYRNYCPHGTPLVDDRNVGKELATCDVGKVCPLGYVCHMNAQMNVTVCCEDPANFCLHARDSGPCEGRERRFGYNSLTDTCVEYDYGGCGGTLNNFVTRERCTEICCQEYRHRVWRDPTANNTTFSNQS